MTVIILCVIHDVRVSFSIFVIVFVHETCYESPASVGLAQARPNDIKLNVLFYDRFRKSQVSISFSV